MPAGERWRRASGTFGPLAFWLVAAIGSLPLLPALAERTAPAGVVQDSESHRFDLHLRERFAMSWQHVTVAVVTGLPQRADSEDGRALLRRLFEPVASMHETIAVISPASSLDTMLVGRDGRTAIALIGMRAGGARALDAVRNASSVAVAGERSLAPHLTVRFTGYDAVVEDLRHTGITETRRAELLALPLTLLVLVWAFRGVGRTLVALAIAALAIVAALGAISLVSHVIPVTSFVAIVASVVGLGLTLDYSLFVLWRSVAGEPTIAIVRQILLAATLVALAFVALLVVPAGELRGAAAGGAIVAIVCGVCVSTLAPRYLAGHAGSRRPVANRWHRWGRAVTARPLLALIGGLAPLVLLASYATRAKLETPLGSWLPSSMQSVAALHDLEAAGRSAIAGTARVILEMPEGTPVLTPGGWRALDRTRRTIETLPSAASVRSIGTVGTGDLMVALHVLPDALEQALVGRDGRSALIEVLPDVSQGRESAMQLVHELRTLDASRASGLPGATFTVGGLAAYTIDYAHAARTALPCIVLVVSAVTWLVIAVTLRAPLAATKAVALNLLVAAAAIGATVLVYQDGQALWLDEPTGSILPTVPLLAFGAAFGISIDYELFLLVAVREQWRRGADAATSAAGGVAAVGGVITRSALVMACLFFALATSDFMPLAMVGFALGVAVVLDATLVRLLVAPALLRIAGEWNWWPGNREAR